MASRGKLRASVDDIDTIMTVVASGNVKNKKKIYTHLIVTLNKLASKNFASKKSLGYLRSADSIL